MLRALTQEEADIDDDEVERCLIVNGRKLDVIIRSGFDDHCAHVFEDGKPVLAISPFVSGNAPDWMMIDVIAEAIERQAAYYARVAAAGGVGQ